MDLFYSMLIYLYYFGRPVVLLAGLILSIIIICTKDRMTKLLGIWLIVSDIGGLLGSVYVLMIRFISRTEIAGRLSTFNTMVTAFLGIVGAVIFALYAIKKYGFKLYWAIIMIAGSSSIGVLLRLVLSKALTIKDFTSAVQYNYILAVITAIPSLVVAVIWFIVFFKNKYKEKELKLLWLMPLYTLASYALNFIVNLYSFIYAAKDASLAQEQQMIVLLSESVVSMVISLLFNIYILVKGRKASEDSKLIIVDD